jgi:uncharacterized membrane protein
MDTEPSAINRKGWIVGRYEDSKFGYHGFVRKPDGKFKFFATGLTAINGAGEMCGYSGSHGYLRAGRGTATVFDVVGASQTRALAINDSGVIAGQFLSGRQHGFVRAPDGTITTFDPPGSTYTFVMGINAAGTVVGTYTDNTGDHAYLRDAAGNYITFDPIPNGSEADQLAINDRGVVAGGWEDSSNSKAHAFIRRANGSIKLLVPPDSSDAEATGINNRDDIIGLYDDTGGVTHGFLRTR